MTVPAWARRPDWADALVADVDKAFRQTGRGTPGWSDPHDGNAPDEDEYSRCSDPGKYEILVTRLAAWQEVLQERDLAAAEDRPVDVDTWLGAHRGDADVAWVRALVSSVAGGPLLFARTVVDNAPFGLDIGLAAEARPTVLISTVPRCGCDACDDGSERLLAELDAAILSTARGGVLHARDDDRTITAALHGYSGTGEPPESWLDPTSEVPTSVERWVGTPWLEA